MNVPSLVKGFLLIVVLVATASGMTSCFLSELAEREKQRAEVDKGWQVFHDRMRATGCKVTSFVATSRGYAVRPIWTCPDGSVEAGREQ